MDDEPGADRQNCRLQQQPQHLRHGAESAGDVAGAAARQNVTAIKAAPALRDAADHAHGRDRFGVAAARLHQRVARHGKLRGAAGRPPGQHFGHDGERDQDDRAGERGEADIGMEQETNGEVDRHPGQIEQGDRPGAGQKPAHGIEIADRLRTLALAADLERQADDGVVHAHAHRLVEAMADADQDAAADRVDDALRGVQAGHQDQQRDERRHAAAGQHPVVDFQHEQRAGEHQQIAHAAEQRDGEKGSPAGGERSGEFGTRERLPQRAGKRAHERVPTTVPGAIPSLSLQMTGRRGDHHSLVYGGTGAFGAKTWPSLTKRGQALAEPRKRPH